MEHFSLKKRSFHQRLSGFLGQHNNFHFYLFVIVCFIVIPASEAISFPFLLAELVYSRMKSSVSVLKKLWYRVGGDRKGNTNRRVNPRNVRSLTFVWWDLGFYQLA